MSQGTTLLMYKGHTNAVYAVKWSPNGRYLASGGNDGSVQVWDAFNGTCLCTYQEPSSNVQAIAWSPDSTYLVSGYDNKTLHIWDALQGTLILKYQGHTDEISSVSWSKSHPHLIASGSYGYDETVQVWDARNGVMLFQQTLPYDIEDVAWSPDGSMVACAGLNTLWLVDGANGDIVVTYEVDENYEDGIKTVSWAPNGLSVAFGRDDATVQVWDPLRNAIVAVYRGHTGPIHTVAWSPNGKLIASTSDDCTVRIWDATTGRETYVYGGHAQSTWVRPLTWSPDGQYIASGGYDGVVRVWQAVP